MTAKKYGSYCVFLIGVVSLFLFCFVRIWLLIAFDCGCGDHLKRAADANTISLEKQELQTAVKYLEDNKLTEGSTKMIFDYPRYELGFFYANLRASLTELDTISPQASQLEKSNVLLKLRETLIDHGSYGDSVTCPEGITVFPHQWFYLLWGAGSLWVVSSCLCVWIHNKFAALANEL
jgi:hypothetical protein